MSWVGSSKDNGGKGKTTMLGVRREETYIRLRAHSNSLRALSKRIPHINIVQLEIARPDSQSRSKIVTRLRFLALGSDNGDLVRGVLRVVLCVAKDSQGTAELGDVDLLCVGAGLDEDDLFAGGGV